MTKAAIARSFSRAADSYDAAAHLQRRIADALLAEVSAQTPPVGGSVADLGCGTGYALPGLARRLQPKPLYALDLSAAMLARAGIRVPGVRPVLGDLEALPWAPGSQRLLFSSLAVQWLDQPEPFLSEAYRVLEPGGMLAFSTLIQGTLAELHQAWAAADAGTHVNDCLPRDVWDGAIDASGFEAVGARSECIVVEYDSPLDLLRELKALGANHVKERDGSVSRRTVNAMLRAYRDFRTPAGRYPASWSVLYRVLRKPV